jgi:DNA-binding NarL/FixJ family response regulator
MFDTVDRPKINQGSNATPDSFAVLIEGRPFLRECIRRSMQSTFSVPLVTFSTLSEFGDQACSGGAALVILSLIEASKDELASALKDLSEGVSSCPVVVLASANDADLARAAIQHGAKGYIPVTMGFEVAAAAIQFVLAGGTYAPTDHFLTADQGRAKPAMAPGQAGALTSRETSVVSAIKRGKSNKIIAYDLNMCESTVKVHVRNIMKKLNAKNRTDVAMRA